MVEVDIHVRGLEEPAAQSRTHLAQSLSLFNSTTQSLSFYLEPASWKDHVYKGPVHSVQFIHYQHSRSLYMP